MSLGSAAHPLPMAPRMTTSRLRSTGTFETSSKTAIRPSIKKSSWDPTACSYLSCSAARM
eukprot:4789497-Prymnesium_polylepis.1